MTGRCRHSKAGGCPLSFGPLSSPPGLTEYVFAHQLPGAGGKVHHGLSLDFWPRSRALPSCDECDVRAQAVLDRSGLSGSQTMFATPSGRQRRRRRASRPCTHDQNVSFDIRHYSSPRSSGHQPRRTEQMKVECGRDQTPKAFGAKQQSLRCDQAEVIRYQLP